VVVGLAAIVVLAIGFFWRRLVRGRREGERPSAGSGRSDGEASPRDRLVALSESIRAALTVPLGTACRAKTIEELAADERLEPLLGEEGRRDLIRFLDQIDRLKFAPERADQHDGALQQALSAWEPCIVMLRDGLQAKR
jgi:hypothetical protein